MKIYYIGNFTQQHCTEVHLALTLEDLGHEVIRAQENELNEQWAGDLVYNGGADLVLYTRTWGDFVRLVDLEYLKANGITTASYHLDLYVGLSRKYLHKGKRLEEVLQTDPFWQTDFVFTPDGDPESAKVFAANGVNHYYIRPGVFKGECVMAEPNQDATGTARPIDVLFVGGGDYPDSPNGYGHPEWPYRDQLIHWLRSTYGDRFTKFGHPQQTVRNKELNQLYANSKVVVGDSVCIDFKHKEYWSDRVYETIGRGGFIIHPYIEGMDTEFVDGKTIVFYKFGDWNELKAKIDHFIAADDEREKIRLASHNYVKENCTYHNRLQEALSIIGSNNVAKKEQELQEAIDRHYEPITASRINLGAGSEPTEGWTNVDWIEQPGIDVVHNLLEYPWPFDSNCADEIKAIDVLEHMPMFTADNQSNPIKFIEECHRILKPGGVLTIQVPHYKSPNLWIDPTHVRGYDPRSFDYFDDTTELGKSFGYYSECRFIVHATTSIMQNQTITENNGKPSNVTYRMVKI